MYRQQVFRTLEEIAREFERQRAEENDSDKDTISEVVSEEEDGALTHDVVEDEFDAEENKEEKETSDEENEGEQEVGKIFYGKNGYQWRTKSFMKKTSKTPAKNIVLKLPGPKGEAKNKTSPFELFSLLITEDILQTIILHTNHQIEIDRARYTTYQWYLEPTDMVEIKALIGILFMAGALKDAKVRTIDMWSAVFGPPFFRSVMNKNRFEFLINNLRFDDRATRLERRKADKFAAFRDIWNVFTERCRSLYIPSEYVTVDESLLSFRGRCPFKMYLPSKPDKYGLKIISICDAKTFYFYGGIPYIGKESIVRETNISIPTCYVLKLTEPIHGTNRNVTVDNWFASCELADKLLEKKLTMTGTLRKNKPEIPPDFIQTKKRSAPSTKFLFRKEKMLVSYVPKKNKNVVLLSSFHDEGEIEKTSDKSNVVLFYNESKGGVDVFDLLCHLKTTARKTRRWPLRYFYGMLDAAGVNTFVLYTHNGGTEDRNLFLKSLAYSLVEEEMKRRVQKQFLPKELIFTMKKVMKHFGTVIPEPILPEARLSSTSRKRKRCSLCPREKDRKGVGFCSKCKSSICAEHKLLICENCVKD